MDRGAHAHQDLGPVLQRDHVEDRGARLDRLHPLGRRQREIDALVLEEVLQLGTLEPLDHQPRLPVARLQFRARFGGVAQLQDQVGHLEIERADRLAKRAPERAVAEPDRDVVADQAEHVLRPAVGRQRLLALALRRKDPPGLPFPLVERVRRARRLRLGARLAGEPERLVQPPRRLVETAHAPEGERLGTRVAGCPRRVERRAVSLEGLLAVAGDEGRPGASERPVAVADTEQQDRFREDFRQLVAAYFSGIEALQCVAQVVLERFVAARIPIVRDPALVFKVGRRRIEVHQRTVECHLREHFSEPLAARQVLRAREPAEGRLRLSLPRQQHCRIKVHRRQQLRIPARLRRREARLQRHLRIVRAATERGHRPLQRQDLRRQRTVARLRRRRLSLL